MLRGKEWAFLPDAVHTEPQARSRLETGGAWGRRSLSVTLTSSPTTHTCQSAPGTWKRRFSITRKLYLSPKLSELTFLAMTCNTTFLLQPSTHTHTYTPTCTDSYLEKCYIKKSKPIIITWDSLWHCLTFFLLLKKGWSYSLTKTISQPSEREPVWQILS